MVEATPYMPTVATKAALASGAGGTKSVVDDVTVSGSGIGIGNGAPTSAALAWKLVGPVPAVANSATVDWTGAPVLDSGTITVTGDGIRHHVHAADRPGLLPYTEDLAATTAGSAATQGPGTAAETVSCLAPPTVTTGQHHAPDLPRSARPPTRHRLGTFGYGGSVAWALVGPVPPSRARAPAWTGPGQSPWAGIDQLHR